MDRANGNTPWTAQKIVIINFGTNGQNGYAINFTITWQPPLDITDQNEFLLVSLVFTFIFATSIFLNTSLGGGGGSSFYYIHWQ